MLIPPPSLQPSIRSLNDSYRCDHREHDHHHSIRETRQLSQVKWEALEDKAKFERSIRGVEFFHKLFESCIQFNLILQFPKTLNSFVFLRMTIISAYCCIRKLLFDLRMIRYNL